MKGSIPITLILFLSSCYITGCGVDPYRGKFAVVKEQCHLYKDRSLYYRAKEAEKNKDLAALRAINSSNSVSWAYKGSTVYLAETKGQLVKIKLILPIFDIRHTWWVPEKDLHIRKTFYEGYWDRFLEKLFPAKPLLVD